MSHRPHKSAARSRRHDMPLNVLPQDARGPIRRSKSGPRRAWVLAAVQALMIAHVVLWLIGRRLGWFDGATITPVEPSESMEFTKQGVINAGLILFTVALLSTLMLGRWFCGWGCHVVLLQDLCAWLMRRFGIRPKPFRSRLLIFIPLGLALYMFIMPAVHRWGLAPVDARLADALGPDHWLVASVRETSTFAGFPLPADALAPWRASAHLTTTEFWATFPGILVAIPFLLICGFVVVYFLGSKGFCTYGCPYGGFFAPLDELAPARIRVTDACEHCGHCTAVCTSNVRVHEEVREYGMVVDPGCMKCLDCVSVCPNDALYFGFGKPAVVKGKARQATPKRTFDLSWPEEIALATVFLLSFLAWRGVYGAIPMLMAVGIALSVTYLTWKLWRLCRNDSVNLHRYRLKFRGRWNRSGIVLASLTAAVALLTMHSGLVRGAFALAQHSDQKIHRAVSAGDAVDDAFVARVEAQASRTTAFYRFAGFVGRGGVGLLPSWQPTIAVRITALYGLVDAAYARRAASLRDEGFNDQALSTYESALERLPRAPHCIEDYVRLCSALGRQDRGRTSLASRSRGYPDDVDTMLARVIIELQSGEGEAAHALAQRAVRAAPLEARTHLLLADILEAIGDVPGARAHRAQAAELGGHPHGDD